MNDATHKPVLFKRDGLWRCCTTEYVRAGRTPFEAYKRATEAQRRKALLQIWPPLRGT